MAKRLLGYFAGDGTYREANTAMEPVARDFWTRLADTAKDGGYKPVHLHPKYPFVDSTTRAQEVGLRLIELAPKDGDVVAPMTVHWPLPENGGIPIRAIAPMITEGRVRASLISNCLPDRPGLVGQAAIALLLENMGMAYGTHYSRHIVSEDESGPAQLWQELREFEDGMINPDPSQLDGAGKVEVLREHLDMAREALDYIRNSCFVVVCINAASMTMGQGWVHKWLCDLLGITPIFVGSNELNDLMAKAPDPKPAIRHLEAMRMKFNYSGGLTEEMVERDMRMQWALEQLRVMHGAIAMGNQGQKDTSQYIGATDLADSITSSPGPFRYWAQDARPCYVATEMDFDGLITGLLQQVLVYIKYGVWPVTDFHDVRHPVDGKLVLLNSGTNDLVNVGKHPDNCEGITVETQNTDIYFPFGGGGISAEFRANPLVSMHRLFTRPGASVVMQATRPNFLPITRAERLSGECGRLDQGWPFALAELPLDVITFFKWFVPNHSHTVVGYDIIALMAALCKILGWEHRCLGV
jgi:hypothetical protein